MQELHLGFVVAGANLRARVFGLKGSSALRFIMQCQCLIFPSCRRQESGFHQERSCWRSRSALRASVRCADLLNCSTRIYRGMRVQGSRSRRTRRRRQRRRNTALHHSRVCGCVSEVSSLFNHTPRCQMSRRSRSLLRSCQHGSRDSRCSLRSLKRYKLIADCSFNFAHSYSFRSG